MVHESDFTTSAPGGAIRKIVEPSSQVRGVIPWIRILSRDSGGTCGDHDCNHPSHGDRWSCHVGTLDLAGTDVMQMRQGLGKPHLGASSPYIAPAPSTS
ncbi:MAG: hypothetical protein QM784_35365 [Polyangiaceae bacterium]